MLLQYFRYVCLTGNGFSQIFRTVCQSFAVHSTYLQMKYILFASENTSFNRKRRQKITENKFWLFGNFAWQETGL